MISHSVSEMRGNGITYPSNGNEGFNRSSLLPCPTYVNWGFPIFYPGNQWRPAILGTGAQVTEKENLLAGSNRHDFFLLNRQMLIHLGDEGIG